MSAFLVVRNPAGDVLLGRPQKHSDWAELGCLPAFRVREIVKLDQWILPASHFLMDESPDQAATRIARAWAGISGAKPRLVVAESQLFPTEEWAGTGRSRKRRNHWALCFLYEVRSRGVPRRAPGWAELKFVPVRDLKSYAIGRSHDDILRSYEKARQRAPPRRSASKPSPS